MQTRRPSARRDASRDGGQDKTTTTTTTKEFEGYSKIWHEAAKSLRKTEEVKTTTTKNQRRKKGTLKREDEDEEENNSAFSKLLDEKEHIAKDAIREREKQHEKLAARKTGGGFQNLVRTTGTASDKIASNTIAVQDDAAANLKQLESLLELCEKARVKGGKRGAAQAMQALEELFKTVLLPSDRKLKYFADQNLKESNKFPHERKRLMYWYVEDYIKRCYHRFVQSLEVLSKDPLTILKEKSMKCAFGLLVNKPEAELQLLRLLTNKLGDPQRKMASNASHLLLEVTVKHPMMKSIVAREVEQFMFRRGVSLKAQYYGAVLLNQMPLSHKGNGPKLAKQLVETYFGLFQFLYDKSRHTTENNSNEEDNNNSNNNNSNTSKDSSTLVNGQKKKRFHPKGGRGNGGRGRGRGRDKKGASTPTTSNSANEQIGSGVDARVVSALLTGINRAFPYVAQSERESMVEKIAPALFTTAHSPNLAASIQALTLIFQLHSSKKSSSITDRYYRALYEVCNHPQVPKAAHAAPFLSLVFKSLKADNNNNSNSNNRRGDAKKHRKRYDDNDDDDDDDDKKDEINNNEHIARSLAIVKRLLQVAMHAPATFACGALMATSEVFRIRPAHWKMVEKEERKIKKSVTNGVSMEGEENESKNEEDGEEEGKENTKNSNQGKFSNSLSYDPYKREPLYANAHLTCLWELTALASNVHPSVAAMAKSLLNGEEVFYDGDPLMEMTLMSFLDKWLMKKVGSKIAKKAKSSVFNTPTAIAQSSFVPGTLEFAAMKESEVDPSEIFFHRYYSVKQSEKLTKLKLEEKDAADDENGSESEEEESDEEDGKKKKSDFGHSESDDDSDSEKDDEEEDDEDDDEEEDSDSDFEDARAKKKMMKDFVTDDEGDTDEEDIVAKAENKEEKIDTDKFNYDALAAAYGEKPGYLLSKKKRKASKEEEEEEEDDDDKDFIEEENSESEDDEVDYGDSDDNGGNDDDEEEESDEDELKDMLLDDDDDDDDDEFGDDDDVFASAEDYEEKIESDFEKNAPVNPEFFSSSEKKQKKRRKSR